MLVRRCGEVPKRLKGLPWKGSRSLIAVRGFKSHLLRFCMVWSLENAEEFLRWKDAKKKIKKLKKVVDKKQNK